MKQAFHNIVETFNSNYLDDLPENDANKLIEFINKDCLNRKRGTCTLKNLMNNHYNNYFNKPVATYIGGPISLTLHWHPVLKMIVYVFGEYHTGPICDFEELSDVLRESISNTDLMPILLNTHKEDSEDVIIEDETEDEDVIIEDEDVIIEDEDVIIEDIGLPKWVDIDSDKGRILDISIRARWYTITDYLRKLVLNTDVFIDLYIERPINELTMLNYDKINDNIPLNQYITQLIDELKTIKIPNIMPKNSKDVLYIDIIKFVNNNLSDSYLIMLMQYLLHYIDNNLEKADISYKNLNKIALNKIYDDLIDVWNLNRSDFPLNHIEDKEVDGYLNIDRSENMLIDSAKELSYLKNNHNKYANLFRLHYIDIRSINDTEYDNIIYIHDTYIPHDIWKNRSNNIDLYEEYVNAIYKHKLIEFNSNIYQKLLEILLNEPYSDFINTIVNLSLGGIVEKEIKKSYFSKEIMEYTSSVIKEHLNNLDQAKINKHIKNLNINPSNSKNKHAFINAVNYIADDLFYANTGIYRMDAYTLSRVFKKFDVSNSHDPKYPKNIILYAGDAHSRNYRNFLNHIGFNMINAVKTPDYDRCIDVSKFPQPFFSFTPEESSESIFIIKNLGFRMSLPAIINNISNETLYKHFYKKYYYKVRNFMRIYLEIEPINILDDVYNFISKLNNYMHSMTDNIDIASNLIRFPSSYAKYLNAEKIKYINDASHGFNSLVYINLRPYLTPDIDSEIVKEMKLNRNIILNIR